MSRPADRAAPAFYEEAYARASSSVARIRDGLPSFPMPELRVQRVGQLDANLLDQELADLLAQPVTAALRRASPSLERRYSAEISMMLRLILYKFSIYDRRASYGAMLQNLRYRNEWAAPTTRDAPLSRMQLALYPLCSIIAPYSLAKAHAYMSAHQYDQAPRESAAFVAYALWRHAQRLWNLASLVNFGLFLWNGKYRTITDRLLGMRLVYANRALHRHVSFEFLNRQLVWNALTEFLLFLLPLIRPQRVLRRIAQLPSHPAVLGIVYDVLPRSVSRRMGLQVDESDGQVRMARWIKSQRLGRYWYLPDECCPLCFERLEREAGVYTDTPPSPPPLRRAAIPEDGRSMRLPSETQDMAASQPRRRLDHRAESGSDDKAAHRAERLAARRAARHGVTAAPGAKRPTLHDTSPMGIKYMDALIVTPYRTLPCATHDHACQYCYVCIAETLRDENVQLDLQQVGGWPCLRCGEYVWGAERVPV